MTDIAALGFEVDSDQLKEANLQLKAMPQAASAAERAAKSWGVATVNASSAADDFSKRVQKTVRDLDFQAAQLQRTAREQEKYAALRRAGVSSDSAAGQAVLASVAALQAQRAASQQSSAGNQALAATANLAGAGFGAMGRMLGPVAIALLAVEQARKIWDAGMKAAELPDQAAQVNVLVEQLQAYRAVALENGVSTEVLDQGLMRLTQTMGAASRGGDDQIKMFEKLGVKILDSNGQLRSTADVLPEVARGLLGLSSTTERNATMAELFGRSGQRMVTMLQALAEGNDAVVMKARQAGLVMDTEVAEAWNRLKTAMDKAGAAADVTWAKLGAPIATWALEKVEALLRSINANLDRVKQLDATVQSRAAANDTKQLEEQLAAQQGLLAVNPNNKMAQASIAGLQQRIEQARRAEQIARQAEMAQDEANARGGPKLPVSEALPGVANPVPKGQADAYTKIISSAQQYIAQKKVETQAIGMNAEAAARLTHEQELLGKAANDNIKLGPAQIAQLKQLAAQMAAADSAFKSAKFMDDLNKSTREYISNQQIEQATIGMSTEAAAKYRFEQEMLAKAANDNIVLTQEQRDQIGKLADQMARAQQKTSDMKEAYEFAKSTVTGFFTDLNQSLRQGATIWEAFGNAAQNVLSKISDKLMQMAVDKLFENAFGGSGGFGSIFNGIGGWLGGLLGGGVSNTVPGTSTSFADALAGGLIPVAKGGVFQGGNIVPFANGGVVSHPTLFPMANGGTGLMGEAGPEGVMPLRRGVGGKLGVQGQKLQVSISLDSDLLRAVVQDESGKVVATATPSIVNSAVKKANDQVVPTMNKAKADRGGDWRTAA